MANQIPRQKHYQLLYILFLKIPFFEVFNIYLKTFKYSTEHYFFISLLFLCSDSMSCTETKFWLIFSRWNASSLSKNNKYLKWSDLSLKYSSVSPPQWVT